MENRENPNLSWSFKTVSSTSQNDFQNEFIKTIKSDFLNNSGSFSTSRYGRARKPKITEDYYCSDEVISPMLSPVSETKTTMAPNSSKAKIVKKSKEYCQTSLNGVKSRLTLDDTNCFSDMDSDYNSLLKIVSRPSYTETISPTSPTFKYSSLKTYSNRKKRTSECSNKSLTDDILSKLDSFSWTQMDSNMESSTPEKSMKSNAKRKLLLNNSMENGKVNSIAERILLEFCCETENEMENPSENNVSSSDNHTSGVSRFIESDLLVEKKEEMEKIEEVQSPIIDSSTQIKHEQSPVVNPGQWKVGDLIWSRVGNHPLWPSMIIREPGSNLFIHDKGIGRRRSRIELHVRFFADCGRRGWVSACSALQFNGRKAFDEMAEAITPEMRKKDRKYVAGFTLNPSSKKLVKKWNQAVDEAESLMLKTVSERLKYFVQIIAENNKKKLQTLVEKQQKKTKSKDDNSENSQTNETKVEDIANKKLKSIDSDKKIEDHSQIKNVEKLNSSEINEKEAGDIAEHPKNKLIVNKTPTTSKYIYKKKKNISRDHFKSVYPVRERKTVERYNAAYQDLNVSEKNQSQIDEIKKEDEESSDELENKTLSDRIESTRTSTPSSTPSVLSQTISSKKKNLFKGTTKDKLCQICEKPVNVFKCRGTCLRYYHQKCASNPEKYRKLIKAQIEEKSLTDDESSLDSDNENETLNEKNNKIPQKFSTKSKNKDRIEPIKTVTLTLAEQIDAKMAELMKDCDKIKYAETSTEESGGESDNNSLSEKIVYHVTGDSSPVIDKNDDKKILSEFKCKDCTENRIPACFICGSYENEVDGIKSERQKCSFVQCGRVYHPKCLELWPQTEWTSSTVSSRTSKKEIITESLICPIHVCHTCVSDDPRGLKTRFSKDKLAKCIRCPTAYHASNYCVAAGSEILSYNQIICPKHISTKQLRKSSHHLNATWCFICAVGGSLICCETCPTSFHAECLQINPPEGSYICEDCETGRLPLYNEVVWVKLGSYRWWPAQILFPYEIPENILSRRHQVGEFAVKFFGSHDYYWINRGRVFLYQEGDSGSPSTKKSNVDELFMKALEEAAEVFKTVQMERKNREAEWIPSLKPPPYIRIKTNKPVGNVRIGENHTSSLTPCECSPDAEDPCGPDSDCLNRLLLTECNVEICPAGTKCCNQQFEKREYPQLVPYQTGGRGWGLKTLEPIKKGQFVIEYVGEMINEEEYQRRIKRMNEQKHENYYFLTIDKDRMLDAGPKGNVARFMNHSCQPNCETQKWTVNGNTRVGLFALQDIPPDTELTFNYNLECIGKEKKICKCGTSLCSGFIGVKAKQEELNNKVKKIRNKSRIKYFSPKIKYISKSTNVCFICGQNGSDGKCRSKMCSKMYHMACVKLDAWPNENWWCPRHKCHLCSRQKNLKWCSKCIRSFCLLHVENNFIEGITEHVCTLHKDEKEKSPEKITEKNEDTTQTNSTKELSIKNQSRVKLKKKIKQRISLSLKHKHKNSNKNENKRISTISDSAKQNISDLCEENKSIIKLVDVDKQKMYSNDKKSLIRDTKSTKKNHIKRQLTVRKLSLRNTTVHQTQQAIDNNNIESETKSEQVQIEENSGKQFQQTNENNPTCNEEDSKTEESFTKKIDETLENIKSVQEETSISETVEPATPNAESTPNTSTIVKRKRGRPRKSEKPNNILNAFASAVKSTENIPTTNEHINKSTDETITERNMTPVRNNDQNCDIEISDLNQNNPSVIITIDQQINNMIVERKDKIDVPLKKRKLDDDSVCAETEIVQNKTKKRKFSIENENQQPKRLLRNSINKLNNSVDSTNKILTNESAIIVIVNDDSNLPIRKRSGLRSLTLDRLSTNSI